MYWQIQPLILSLSPFKEQLVLFSIQADISDVDEFMDKLRESFKEEVIQAVDADIVMGPRHLQAAVFHALAMQARKESWIKDPSLRILAFLTCDKQVQRAIGKAGLKTRIGFETVVAVVTKSPHKTLKAIEIFMRGVEATFKPELLKVASEDRIRVLMEIHGISEEEIRASGRDKSEALISVMIERMSLLPLSL